ncbi:MAG: hypothetical protein LBP89_02080 [Helicobacteraceae bacterium]|jgi:hypothetical protein|nr:hypothetical protein [Helicobacteraceae bacterium]
MFILGMHFPKERGNKIPSAEVAELVDKSVDMGKVKEIKLHQGSTKSTKMELYKTISKKDTFLAKALVHFYNNQETSKEGGVKYMYFTNKYQIAELSLEIDKDAECFEIAKKFQDMEPINVEVVFA